MAEVEKNRTKIVRISQLFRLKVMYDKSKRLYNFFVNDTKSKLGYNDKEKAMLTAIEVLYHHLLETVQFLELKYPYLVGTHK